MKFDSVNIVTKNQNKVTLRMIEPSEAQALLSTMVEIAETSPYLLTDANFFRNTSLDFETKWIESYNNDSRSILIIAELKNKIIGLLDFKPYKNARICHRGILGISLHPSVRGEGIGEKLFDKFITEVQKIDDLMIVELKVVGDNQQAYHLYKKMGFVEIGRNPDAFKLADGKFSDDVEMVLRLK